jgi:lipoprotein-anchoring transpeptidase ErfK/SrfK
MLCAFDQAGAPIRLEPRLLLHRGMFVLRCFRVNAALCGLATMLFTTGLATTANAQSKPVKPEQAKAELIPVTTAETIALDVPFPVGALIIVNDDRRLYYISAKGQAVRYPIAVGKANELWTGRTFVSAKRVDPEWVSVTDDNYYEGGDPKNPLGRRAMYLDWSLLRIHGTPARKSIGSATSNGCIRMLNEDVIDLFDRVHLGAPVFAIQSLNDPNQVVAAPVGAKIYADPEARRLAKEREDAGYDEQESRQRAASERARNQRRASTPAGAG